jgi:hypothetical protein
VRPTADHWVASPGMAAARQLLRRCRPADVAVSELPEAVEALEARVKQVGAELVAVCDTGWLLASSAQGICRQHHVQRIMLAENFLCCSLQPFQPHPPSRIHSPCMHCGLLQVVLREQRRERWHKQLVERDAQGLEGPRPCCTGL